MAGAGAARPADDRERLVPRSVAVIGAWSWRLVAAGLVGWALLGLLDRLRVVVFPVVVAGILTVPLATVADGLRRRGVPPAASAALVLAGFLAAGAGAAMLIVPPVAREFDDLGPAVEEAYEDLEAWLVDDAPVEISRERLDELEEQGEDAIRSALSGSGGLVVRSAVLVVEIVAGLVLSLVLTFFMVKDGPRFQAFALGFVPEDRQQLVRRMAARAWTTLGGYLRGSALLGTLEAAVIGITLVLLGADLVVPVMVVTFLAAFVPSWAPSSPGSWRWRSPSPRWGRVLLGWSRWSPSSSSSSTTTCWLPTCSGRRCACTRWSSCWPWLRGERSPGSPAPSSQCPRPRSS